MSMIEIPSDLPLPQSCPQCGAGWNGYGTNEVDSTLAILVCEKGHMCCETLTAEEAMRFRLAVEPDGLLSRKVWVVGDDRPFLDIELEPEFAVPGTRITVDKDRYVVESVDVDRVWVRPTD